MSEINVAYTIEYQEHKKNMNIFLIISLYPEIPMKFNYQMENIYLKHIITLMIAIR